jgi:hypothetical protein
MRRSSVGRGGSVGPSKTRSASSASSRRTGVSVVLKIRVSNSVTTAFSVRRGSEGLVASREFAAGASSNT